MRYRYRTQPLTKFGINLGGTGPMYKLLRLETRLIHGIVLKSLTSATGRMLPVESASNVATAGISRGITIDSKCLLLVHMEVHSKQIGDRRACIFFVAIKGA
jgi:hypothetical protein